MSQKKEPSKNRSRQHVRNILKTGTPDEKSQLLEELRQEKCNDVSLVIPLVDGLETESSRAIKERILMILNHLVPLSDFKDADRMLRSPDPFVRNGIVEIIKRSELPIIGFLEKLAADEDKDVRKFVIDALSQEKSEKAIAIIRQRLVDSDINIVYTAIEYLGNFKDTPSVDQIETILLGTSNFMVTISALEALAKIGISPQRDKILEVFMDPKKECVLTFPLLKYLGAFGDHSAFEYFERLLTTNPDTFTKEIIDAISSICTRNPNFSLPPSLKEKLEKLQESTQNQVDRYAIAKLLTCADTSETGTTPTDHHQLQKARKMLQDPSEMVKLCGIEILADIGDKEDVETLEHIAEQTDSDELLEAIGDAVVRIRERLKK